MKTTLPLETARALANDCMKILRPYCQRIEIAGSIRRQKPQVGDIELVATPLLAEQRDLFGNVVGHISLLDDGVRNLVRRGAQVRKNGPKFKQLALPEGITLDLFIVTPPAQWGVIFALRTGPADFSHWLVTSQWQGGGLPPGYYVQDGALWHQGAVVPTPEEDDFLRICNIANVLPSDRRPQWKR